VSPLAESTGLFERAASESPLEFPSPSPSSSREAIPGSRMRAHHGFPRRRVHQFIHQPTSKVVIISTCIQGLIPFGDADETAQEQQETLQEHVACSMLLSRVRRMFLCSLQSPVTTQYCAENERDTCGWKSSIWKYDFQPVSHRTWTFKTG